jgi:hypothetical protein
LSLPIGQLEEIRPTPLTITCASLLGKFREAQDLDLGDCRLDLVAINSAVSEVPEGCQQLAIVAATVAR